MSEIDWKHRLSALGSQIMMREKWRSIGQSQDTMWEAQAIITFPPPTHPPPPLQVPIFLLPGHYCLPTRFPCLQVHLEEGRALPRPGFVFNSHATANDHDLTKGRPLMYGTLMMLSTQMLSGEKSVWDWWGQMFRRQQHLSQIRQQWASSGQQQEDKDWVGTRVV